ncbi:hypothetical protein [Mycobacterium lepromatosis]|uniref:hypothetical protein n=1 Tax=Mycobacterium lepromatosis TaxID=480418 RepID=UPI0006793718|nr:hypothetical protein [Mycobacterium lepromatosis]
MFLTLGVLYVSCAGPVLAVIVVAGGTASIRLARLVLALVFNPSAMLHHAAPDCTVATQKGIGANDIQHKLKLSSAVTE